MFRNGEHNPELPSPKRSIGTTIELPLFLNMISATLTGSAITNIILYRTCVHSLSHSEAECRPFLSPIKTNSTNGLEEDVQKYATFISTVKTVLEYVCPAIISMFLGAWSDTYGRKPLIVWPLFGMSITGLLVVVFGMMESLDPRWYILTAVPFSFTGGYVVLFTGAYCYVSDTSSPKDTSLRMTIVDATTSLGMVVGSMLTSYLILSIGNVYLLLLTAALNVIAYAFTNIWIMESLSGALQGGATRVLDFLLVKEMFRECFKERPNRGRTQIILLAIIKIVMILIMYGIGSLEYLYTRQTLHWSLQQYTIFSAVDTGINFVGGFLGIIILQKLLGLGDIPFTIIISFMAIIKNIIKMLAVQTWHMYLSSVISMFGGVSGALIRSFLTKTLPVEDIAKVFALMCAVESVSPMISPVLYNSLYAATISIFPGAIYALSAILTFSSLVMLGFVQYYSWNRSTVAYERIDSSNDT